MRAGTIDRHSGPIVEAGIESSLPKEMSQDRLVARRYND